MLSMHVSSPSCVLHDLSIHGSDSNMSRNGHNVSLSIFTPYCILTGGYQCFRANLIFRGLCIVTYSYNKTNEMH